MPGEKLNLVSDAAAALTGHIVHADAGYHILG